MEDKRFTHQVLATFINIGKINTEFARNVVIFELENVSKIQPAILKFIRDNNRVSVNVV